MTTAVIERVNEWEKEPGKFRWYVDFVDGTKAVCFSEAAKELETGKPLPDGWVIEPPKQEGWTPMLKAPRKGGFGGAPAAFRNTREGFYAEQQSIHRSVALDKALVFHGMRVEPPTVEQLLRTANELYGWLSLPSPGGQSSVPATNEGGGKSQTTRAPGKAARAPEPAQGTLGEGPPAPAGACDHIDNSPLKPDGSHLPDGFLRCLSCGVVHKGG